MAITGRESSDEAKVLLLWATIIGWVIFFILFILSFIRILRADRFAEDLTAFILSGAALWLLVLANKALRREIASRQEAVEMVMKPQQNEKTKKVKPRKNKHGLYPHEVLMLEYAMSYCSSGGNSFHSFWKDEYKVKSEQAVLTSLERRGFIRAGGLIDDLRAHDPATLRDELKTHGIEASGGKEELIQQLIEEIPRDELNQTYLLNSYQLTELGESARDEEPYIPYIHLNPIEGLDIWSIGALVNVGWAYDKGWLVRSEKPPSPFRQTLWQYLGQLSRKQTDALDFDGYRRTMIRQSEFLREEGKSGLHVLTEAIVFDLLGIKNGTNPREHILQAKEYDVSLSKVSEAAIKEIEKCQSVLGILDEELIGFLVKQFERMDSSKDILRSEVFKIFYPSECAQIVLFERDKNVAELKKLYAEANRRKTVSADRRRKAQLEVERYKQERDAHVAKMLFDVKRDMQESAAWRAAIHKKYEDKAAAMRQEREARLAAEQQRKIELDTTTKCKKCNKQIDDIEVVCPYCGQETPLYAEEVRKMNEMNA